MRIRRSLCVAAVFAVSVAAPALIAQGMIIGGGGGPMGSVTGEPFTATAKTTRVQTLADGTKITHETIAKEARDSAGKTYRETHAELPDNGSNSDFTNVVVFDPANRTQIFWNSR